MPNWTTFVGFAIVVLFLVLFLARASQELITGESAGTADSEELVTEERASEEPVSEESVTTAETTEQPIDTATETGLESPRSRSLGSMSTSALLINVALSQGILLGVLLTGAWLAQIPLWAVGVTTESAGLTALLIGCGFGVMLYIANEVGAAFGEHIGLGRSEELREALAPESVRGWAILLFVVLPVVAGFEELLFRGTLVGVLHAWSITVGTEVSPWLLAGGSSAAFALGHGAQGRTGIAVTGVLGFALAAGFILTNSLLVVFVAHYLVNALEFVVHEGLDIDWLS